MANDVDWANKLKVVLPPSYPVIVGGDVDEVAVYDQALTPQAVKRHYLAGTAL
ncbi:hypothetical protein [Conexibacter sp. CPCC 206217]|uniref:hypothetical protein n=1 Tax=Conexibacter sp. CPCC 206217 TaxID=3064574 RepID=UPI0027190765|nr:hypothetical protein [Conexibacter sp. CPCC 206217]MDO8212145.1 hypothetical protein [Conexibacter sp. CPCC 206217]